MGPRRRGHEREGWSKLDSSRSSCIAMLFSPRTPPSLAERALGLLWPRSGLRRGWRYIGHRVMRLAGSPHAIAIGFAAGVFASMTPFVGLHLILAALLALVLGGSVLASAFGTFFGNPLTYPIIWITTYDVGGKILGGDAREGVDLALQDGTFGLALRDPAEFWSRFWTLAEPVIWPMTVGSLPLGLAVALFSYVLVRFVVSGHHRRRLARQASAARERSRR